MLVGRDGDGDGAGDGLAAAAGVVVLPAPCSDLMYATNCINWSSLTCP